VGDVANMVWRFPNPQTRNAVGRRVRKQGYDCFATGPTLSDEACLLTIEETTDPRRLAVTGLIRSMGHPSRIEPPVV
jgi:hypothetical protein